MERVDRERQLRGTAPSARADGRGHRVSGGSGHLRFPPGLPGPLGAAESPTAGGGGGPSGHLIHLLPQRHPHCSAAGLGLIRSRGHFRRGGYGVQHGRGAKPRRPRRSFTDEFKASAAQRVLEGGKTPRPSGRSRFRSDRVGASGMNEREELTRLRKEVRELRMDRTCSRDQPAQHRRNMTTSVPALEAAILRAPAPGTSGSVSGR